MRQKQKEQGGMYTLIRSMKPNDTQNKLSYYKYKNQFLCIVKRGYLFPATPFAGLFIQKNIDKLK